jgi:hypothetical protein
MTDHTWSSVSAMYALMGFFVVAAAFFLISAIRSGAVSMSEEPKYRMLEDDDVEGP